ncbi:MAG TPA: hypothetical protein DD979_15240 [Gammaproteobacteria bacterium]|jgi:hypothetical protein|nr:hypothetical protein [Gammaproteobacteria bacterium]
MTNRRPPRTDTKPWYRQFWPWLVIFFPATAVVAGLTTVVIAVKSDDGLVEKDYYKKGLLINFSKELDQKASELGLSGFARLDSDSGQIYVLVDDTEAETEAKLDTVVARLKHATRADKDQTIALSSSNTREFRGQMDTLSPGRWHVLIEGAEQWRLRGEITFPHSIATRLAPAVP